jgi:hypothetical protein
MRSKFLFFLVMAVLAFTLPVFAQVATRSGNIQGTVVDEKGSPLPGVVVTLESPEIPAQTATTGATGSYRFANLQPGVYSVNFSLEGFTEVRQEQVKVNLGGSVELSITLKPSLAEEFTVIGETPVVDTKKTGTSENFSREYLDKVPSARDPWVLLEQSAAVDVDRFNVGGSESGQQSAMASRGASLGNTGWNYDGVNLNDAVAAGGTTYMDFDAFEEVQIVNAGSDASIPTNGVQVNIVTKRGGNRYEANASYLIVAEDFVADNTPQEALDLGLLKSTTVRQFTDYGFDLGGPIIKDRLFAWGAYRKNDIRLTRIGAANDNILLKTVNLKANFNWNTSNESQFSYNNNDKVRNMRSNFPAANSAPEAFVAQGNTVTITPGLWTGQHTWTPSDQIIATGRYAYWGLGFVFAPIGGVDRPVIYLSAVPGGGHYEDSSFDYHPDRPTHDISFDVNYFPANAMLGGQNEFKFGFDYHTARIHTLYGYGNGLYVKDTVQTQINGPLIQGYLYIEDKPDQRLHWDQTAFYATDTFRKDRLTLNLGFRFDHYQSENQASTVGPPAGFESIYVPIVYEGGESPVKFNNISPRIGATYDMTGDGKTILRGNFAQYYDAYSTYYASWTNPISFNGYIVPYVNSNGDRTVSLDELDVSQATPFGGLGPAGSSSFDLDAFLQQRLVDPDLKNSHSWEGVVGVEREIFADTSVALTYTHRNYYDPLLFLPTGVSSSDYQPAGNLNVNSSLGNFSVPIFRLPAGFDQHGNPGQRILTNVEDYKQSYDGFDINIRKRMSNNFLINGSMVFQKQKAHYDGGDSNAFAPTGFDAGLSGVIFPYDPNNAIHNDGRTYVNTSTGSGKTGIYPFSEWAVKLSGVYQFPWDITTGAFVRYQQGYPYVLFGSFTDGSLSSALGTTTHLVQLEEFGARRHDNIFTLDLQFQKSFDLANAGRIAFMADLFNVTNENTIVDRTRIAAFGSNTAAAATLNPTIRENLAPRAFRLGLRYSF